MPSCWVFRAAAHELRVNAAMDRGFQIIMLFLLRKKLSAKFWCEYDSELFRKVDNKQNNAPKLIKHFTVKADNTDLLSKLEH